MNDKNERELEKEIGPYPLYPFYGKITRYEDVYLTGSEQRQLRQPGVERLILFQYQSLRTLSIEAVES